jgi:hypothetical protein
MWDDSDNQIKSELSSKERLLWTGRPTLGVKLRAADVFLIPFSLVWGGFAIFWESMVVVQGAPFFFALFGIPFVLIGLYLMFGRFWVDARQRAKTYYGLTNERVIIVSGQFRRSIKSVNIDTLTDVSLTEKSDGSGTITLGPMPPWHHWFGDSSWPGGGDFASPSLEFIDNARQVYEKIRDAQREAKVSRE